MAQLVPYLNFAGTCREAMTFYKEQFGGDLFIQTFGDNNMAENPADKDRVIHSALTFGTNALFASDTMPGSPVRPGGNMHVNVNCDSEAEIDKLFGALSTGGTVSMELQDTFWGARFGMLTDRWSINWMFNFQRTPMPQ